MEFGQALVKSLMEQTERREELLRKRAAAPQDFDGLLQIRRP